MTRRAKEKITNARKDSRSIGWQAAWIVGAFVAAGTAFTMFLWHLKATSEYRAALERRLARWRSKYHLSDEQVRRIRIIEIEFHGTGSPFSSSSHTRDETPNHFRAIAEVMEPEDGKMFLKLRESEH